MQTIHKDAGPIAPLPPTPVPERTASDREHVDNRGSTSVTRSATVVVAVTLQRLVEDATRFWSVEEQLVLDALRRSATRLNEATTEELADYVSALTPEQLRGVASNVKGIYHELLFVHLENADGDEVAARVFKATNHPGADVEFIVDGDTIRAVQLKAVVSPIAILEHLSRYPEIEVVATSEVAELVPGVIPSGFSNGELTTQVKGVFGELPGDRLTREVGEGIAMSALVSGAIAAGRVLRGSGVSRADLSRTFGDAAVGSITATALDALLDGLV